MYHNYKSVVRVKPGGLELKDSLVGVQRVTKVTKGGRTFGFSAIVVVGDENGVVGQGLGKSKDVSSAIGKAVEDAKKNLVRIPIVKVTLPHQGLLLLTLYPQFVQSSFSFLVNNNLPTPTMYSKVHPFLFTHFLPTPKPGAMSHTFISSYVE